MDKLHKDKLYLKKKNKIEKKLFPNLNSTNFKTHNCQVSFSLKDWKIRM